MASNLIGIKNIIFFSKLRLHVYKKSKLKFKLNYAVFTDSHTIPFYYARINTLMPFNL